MARRQPSPPRTPKTAEPTEFDRFARLSKRLRSGAKMEIDEARAREHERARERTGSDDWA